MSNGRKVSLEVTVATTPTIGDACAETTTEGLKLIISFRDWMMKKIRVARNAKGMNLNQRLCVRRPTRRYFALIFS
jgi:hypothetical protein